MTESDPAAIRPDITAELAARRARQRERGELVREGEYDRMVAEANACQGECTAPGSTRGGILLGDGRRTGGMVAIDAQGHPLTLWAVLEGEHQLTRPCYDCNRVRWEAWQDGELRRKVRPGVES